jgi:hypothetical protein
MADFCGLQRIAHVAKINQILARNIEETLAKLLTMLWRARQDSNLQPSA